MTLLKTTREREVEKDLEHPEDLLDRAVRSRLTDAERKSLEQHLSSCEICAAQLRFASAAVQQADANNLLRDRTAANAVLRRLEAARSRESLRSPRRWLQLGTAVVLLSGTATAAAWWAGRTTSAPVAADGPAARSSTGPRRLAEGVVPPNEGSVTGDEIALAEPTPTRLAIGAGQDDRTLPSAKRAIVSAAQLLQQARRRRLDGDNTGARATYLRLQQAYPRSEESQLSHILLGRLYLQSNSPRQAVSQFSLYLAGGGAASEEALVGRATALARLGQKGAEAKAWATLLANYPRSPYAKRARSRLDALNAGAGASSDAARSDTARSDAAESAAQRSSFVAPVTPAVR